MTDLFDQDDDGTGLHERAERTRQRRERRRRRRWRALVVVLVCLALVVVAGWLGAGQIREFARTLGVQDYPGPGSGEVEVVIEPGDTGRRIGQRLADAGVVAEADAFVNALNATPGDEVQPGTYRLRQEMRAGDALSLLRDGSTRLSITIQVREGLWKSEVYAIITRQTGFTTAQLDQAVASAGLPEAAGGDPEGYLFPATYTFDPDVTPEQVVKAMVDKHRAEMAAAGVPEADQRTVLIKASLVQAEASLPGDYAKVARVVENRLARGEPLGIDPTVNFAIQRRGFDLTQSELAVDSPYNTRKYPGLPPGPINSPGAQAIEAAANPAPGDWLYFVTVNADTGETVFTADYQEFLAAKAQWEAWYAANQEKVTP